jgi:hypothetical protein
MSGVVQLILVAPVLWLLFLAVRVRTGKRVGPVGWPIVGEVRHGS